MSKAVARTKLQIRKQTSLGVTSVTTLLIIQGNDEMLSNTTKFFAAIRRINCCSIKCRVPQRQPARRGEMRMCRHPDRISRLRRSSSWLRTGHGDGGRRMADGCCPLWGCANKVSDVSRMAGASGIGCHTMRCHNLHGMTLRHMAYNPIYLSIQSYAHYHTTLYLIPYDPIPHTIRPYTSYHTTLYLIPYNLNSRTASAGHMIAAKRHHIGYHKLLWK